MYNIRNPAIEIKGLRLHSLIIAVFFALGLAQTVSAERGPTMWGDLTPGPHKVGFRAVFRYDLSRPSVPYADWDGRLYPTAQTPGRQMQISVWYPADITAADQRFQFGHYLDLMARQTDFAPINESKKRFAREQFVTKTNALGGNGTFTIENLDTLSNMTTAAYADARPLPGQYPLIVFPNGGSPAFQSIMSEYFASHGFIVAAGVLKGQYGFAEDITVQGFESAVDDIGFIINEVLKLPQADSERICLIGNAITSSQIVAYQSRNARVDCLVSLDGGLLSQFEQKILRQTVFYNPQAVNKPLLAIYAPHPSIDPQFIEHLKFSRQFQYHFPQMSEFHFLNYGAFERFVPGIIGEPKGDVKKGFELAAIYCLRFFEAFLQGNQESLAFLSKKPIPDNAKHIDRYQITDALPSPPNSTTVKNGFLDQGIGYIQDVYASLKKQNPTPFSLSFYSDLKDWLAWKKDPEYENRYQLYQLAQDSYPNSASVHYYLAYFALETGRKDVARKLNKKTLELLDTDNSEELTQERKSEMKKYLLEDLEKLETENES